MFASSRPAELILLRGAPVYQNVTGTILEWVSNTDSDVFRVGESGLIYYLVSGRWFSAPDFTGPWTFATPTLPAAFREIPSITAIARPRVVPGTPQAAEAVLIADIPQTARVSRSLAGPTVTYQGSPNFQPIASTSVSFAVNTDKDVFEVDDVYYMCYQGVWFIADAPAGPWSVTAVVPPAIYQIPPSSPAYNVTFVTVETDDDPNWVEFSAAAAYTGLMIGWGCAVWGTGYYYPPYVGFAGGVPVYFPHFPTYGYSAWYNPWTGSFGRGALDYGPYGGAVVAARYNPVTGTYARGGGLGSAWRRGAGRAYNPRTGTMARGGVATDAWRSWRRGSLQPAHRRVRRHPPRLWRLRQLGHDTGAARRSVGQHLARQQQPDRGDDTHDAGQWRRRGGDACRAGRDVRGRESAFRQPVRRS